MNTIRIQQPNHQNSSAGKWKSSRIGHVPKTRSKHLTRWCHCPWGSGGNHPRRVRGHAPWGAPSFFGRSNGAQTPHGRAAAWQYNCGDGWCSDSGRSRAAGGWSNNNCHLQKKRSRSCHKKRHPYTKIISLEHSLLLRKHSLYGFPRLQ